MFSKDDFADEENVRMLSVVIMVRMNQKPLQNFHKMPYNEKRTFNKLLNEYIVNDLAIEDWKTHLTDEFNAILSNDVFNEDFKAEEYEPKMVSTEPIMLEN